MGASTAWVEYNIGLNKAWKYKNLSANNSIFIPLSAYSGILGEQVYPEK